MAGAGKAERQPTCPSSQGPPPLEASGEGRTAARGMAAEGGSAHHPSPIRDPLADAARRGEAGRGALSVEEPPALSSAQRTALQPGVEGAEPAKGHVMTGLPYWQAWLPRPVSIQGPVWIREQAWIPTPASIRGPASIGERAWTRPPASIREQAWTPTPASIRGPSWIAERAWTPGLAWIPRRALDSTERRQAQARPTSVRGDDEGARERTPAVAEVRCASREVLGGRPYLRKCAARPR
jgi:hypothetical protein